MMTTAATKAVATMVLTAGGALAVCAALMLAVWWSLRPHRGERGRPAPAPDLRRMPAQWPVLPRPIASTAEQRVWRWLEHAFPLHRVMVKLPLTRFTLPRDEQGRAWFEVLSSAYCTFTVVDAQGRVVGCVDVTTPRGQSRANRALKHRLLAQCGIGYWVVAADALPDAMALRAEFLGAASAERPAQPAARTELDTAREQLHEVLDRNRCHRQRAAAPAAADDADDERESSFSQWQQADSFLGALDSRRGDLAAER